jgi:hypothetical protein
MKICTKCNILKSLSNFYKDKRSSDGHYSKCKTCHSSVCMDYQKNHKEDYNTNSKRWSKNNPEKIQSKLKLYRADPKNREKTRQWNANYKSRNKSKINAINAGRRAAQLQATPKWLTAKHKAEIDFFYWLSDTVTGMFGVQHHVDHIEALQGENFRGLHVPWNLQVITAFDNMSKHNKLTA